MTALILIDLQNDFLEKGAVPVPKGEKILPIINKLMALSFSKKVASRDFHPPDHVSFARRHGKPVGETIEWQGITQALWPPHCVMGTWGAEFVEGWPKELIDKIVYKGFQSDQDSYSVFFDNARRQKSLLDHYLKKEGICELAIAGLATDYCVKETVLDGLALGYNTTVIIDGCMGVELTKGDIQRAFTAMEKKGASLLSFRDFEKKIGVAGFEPTASSSRTKRASQAALHPDGGKI